MRRVLTVAAALVAVSAASPAAAEDWEFKLTPYLWAASLDGEIGVFPRLRPVTVDASFGDILDDLQFAAMGSFEARTGKFGILTDVIYIAADVSKSATIADRAFIDVNVKSKVTMATLAALWRVAERDRLSVDVLGGARVVAINPEITLRRNDNVLLSREPDEAWVDAIVGARGAYTLSPRWSLTAYGDIGGLQSDFTWQAYAVATYQVNDSVGLSAGWRRYDVDNDDDRITYDIAQDGPVIAATFSF